MSSTPGMPAGLRYGSQGVYNINGGSFGDYPVGGGNTYNIRTPGGSLGSQTFSNYAEGISAGIGAVGGLMNAFTGYKNYKLAKKEFAFTKALANRNLANQAKMINNSYDASGQLAAGLAGASYNPNRGSGGDNGLAQQAIQDQYQQLAKDKHVNGGAI